MIGRRIEAMLAALGIAAPGDLDGAMLLIAIGLVAAAWLAGWLAGRATAPLIERLVRRRFGSDDPELCRRLSRLVAHGSTSLLLTPPLALALWDPVARVVLGAGAGVAAALFVNRLLRLLRMPGWLALLAALILLTAIVTRALGGFEPLIDALDDIGFDAGRSRISLLSVLRVVVIGVVLFALVRGINRLVHHSLASTRGLDPTQKLLSEKIAAIVVVTVAFFVGIDILGIDLTALAVFSGAFGLAIGFGFQKTFGNLISGIILLMDRSIKPGDVIVVGDSFGWVNKIGIRAVSVLTRDGKEHLIPNENLMINEVENWSFSSRNVRIRIPVGVAFDSDLALAERLMLQAAQEAPRVLDTPQANVWLIAFGESRVEFEILCWIADPEEGVGNVRSDVLKRLWRLFQDHGVRIPYPQTEIRLMRDDDGSVTQETN